MDQPQIWQMPAPPANYVLSVRDCDGREYLRMTEDGSQWADTDGHGRAWEWDYLIFNRGPITADELAA